jgi:hypothetical protein
MSPRRRTFPATGSRQARMQRYLTIGKALLQEAKHWWRLWQSRSKSQYRR